MQNDNTNYEIRQLFDYLHNASRTAFKKSVNCGYEFYLKNLSVDTKCHLWRNKNNEFFYTNLYGKTIQGSRNNIAVRISREHNIDIVILDGEIDIIYYQQIINQNIFCIEQKHILTIEEDVFYPPAYAATKSKTQNTQRNLCYRIFDYSFVFFKHGLVYKNIFTPNKLLRREYDKNDMNDANNISGFISAMVNDNNNATFIINWLACFYQRLTKSNTILVLLGDKKVSERIFINKIIKPIFGHKYCVTIDDKTLSLESKSKILNNKLFYHFTNIGKKTNIVKARELIEDIATDTIGTFDDVLENDVNIYGQAIITADNIYELANDMCSKCAIFEIQSYGQLYKQSQFDFAIMCKIINNNLHSFTNYLSQYNVDYELIQNYNNNITLLPNMNDYTVNDFIKLIRLRNIQSFYHIQCSNINLYLELEKDLNSGYIKQSNLYDYFIAQYDKNIFTSNKAFIVKLKSLHHMFNKPISRLKYKYYKII